MVVIHKHFRSTAEYANWISSENVLDAKLPHYDWGADGVRNCERARDLLRKGDDSYVHEARALLTQLQENVETPHFTWEHSVVGAFPDVPTYLAGEPENMWFRSTKPDNRSPLRVWVGISSTWSVSERYLRQRGVALAAFAIAMSEVRPVLITPYVNLDGRDAAHQAIVSFDVSTSPLVTAELLPSVSDALITRHLGIPACFSLNRYLTKFPGGPFHQVRREHMNCADDDLWLPPCYREDPEFKDPIAWIKKQVAKYGQEDDE